MLGRDKKKDKKTPEQQADEKAMSDLKSAHSAEYDQLKRQYKDKMDQGGS